MPEVNANVSEVMCYFSCAIAAGGLMETVSGQEYKHSIARMKSEEKLVHAVI